MQAPDGRSDWVDKTVADAELQTYRREWIRGKVSRQNKDEHS